MIVYLLSIILPSNTLTTWRKLMQLEAFDDAGNFVFVAAYLVKDILWLRLLSIAGSLVVLP